MIIKKCKNDHMYDSEKFVVCPHCALEKVYPYLSHEGDSSYTLEETEDIEDIEDIEDET